LTLIEELTDDVGTFLYAYKELSSDERYYVSFLTYGSDVWFEVWVLLMFIRVNSALSFALGVFDVMEGIIID